MDQNENLKAFFRSYLAQAFCHSSTLPGQTSRHRRRHRSPPRQRPRREPKM